MDIQLPIAGLLPARPEIRGIAGLLARLQPGQQIDAVVATKLELNAYLLRLADGGQLLRARSQLPLTPGQSLRLEVVKPGTTPELKIVPDAPLAPETLAVQQAVRRFLPRQTPLNELAGSLHQALSRLSSTQPLSRSLTSALRAVIDALPQRSDLTNAEGLKHALRNSGLFFEAKQALQHESTAPSDLKGRLLDLLGTAQRLQAQAAAAPGTRPEVATERNAEAQAEQPADADPTNFQPRIASPEPGPPASRAVGASNTPAGEAPAPAQPPIATDAAKSGAETSAAETAGTSSTESAATPSGPPVPDLPDAAVIIREAATDSGAETTQAAPEQAAAEGRQSPPAAADQPESAAARHPPTPDGKPDAAKAGQTGDPTADLQPELRSLLHKTEGALAKIVMDQLASLPQDDGKQALWQLEIPFSDGHRSGSAKLRIRREAQPGSGAEQAYWSVVLELNPPGLGTVHSRITLNAGRVDTYFWADRSDTTHLIGANLDLLAARLQQSGLDVGRLDKLPGAPTGGSGDSKPPSKLLDERA